MRKLNVTFTHSKTEDTHCFEATFDATQDSPGLFLAKELFKEQFADCSDVINVHAECDGFEAFYALKIINGEVQAIEVKNDFPVEYIQPKKSFLTSVDPSNNKYGYYELEPVDGKEAVDVWNNLSHGRKEELKRCGCLEGEPLAKVSFGRMAVESGSIWDRRSYYYPITEFWLIHQQKISEGYKDISDIQYDKGEYETGTNGTTKKARERVESPSTKLFETLKSFSMEVVKTAKINVSINSRIIKESRELLAQMRIAGSVDEFNAKVLDLIAILQRPTEISKSGIANLLANSKDDFGRIIQREEDLILSMEGVLAGNMVDAYSSFENFDDYGVEVYMATDKQKQQVMRKLSDELKPKVKNIYRVIPASQKKKFNQYLEDKGISTVKMLWHGSRNENWSSIIKSSLQLNPNAIITGKMFGDGIYFAPSSMKSWNYTSMRGSYWAKGNSDTAFMGLYAVAYGTPYDISSYGHDMDYKDVTLKNGCDCLFAHKGTMLRNDEIVFYDEAAILLNYIVEFED